MENAKELITSSYEKQKKWMEEHYPDHLIDAHNDSEWGTLITSLEEQVASYMYFQYDDKLEKLIYGY